ncbi:MAG: 4Fe-4S binding protein [Bacillota bacterium]|nr:4Fe-4S binding protein [Bacillota bacterium]
MPRKKASEIRVNDAWCKRCGICIAFCPTRVLEADAHGVPRVANLEACTVCTLCELRCPDFAIEVEEAGEETGAVAGGKAGEEARHATTPAHAG